jgi:hypothetical protein
MKAQLRKQLLTLSLLAPVAACFVAAPVSAAIRTITRAPVVNALQLNADSGVAPGSQLQFTVEGTPRGRANVRIGQSNIVVPLRETSSGVYRGTHTVRRADRIDPNEMLRASITAGQLTTTANYTFPPSFIAQFDNNAQQQAQATAPRIARFVANPSANLEPGTDIRFVLNGVPGGTASVNIPGTARNVPLREMRPGVYRGSYTIRRQDNPNNLNSAAATLRSGDQVVTANLTEPLMASTQSMGAAPMTALPLQVLSPGNNAAIDGNQFQLQGRTAPGASVTVKVDAIAPVFGNRMSVAQPVVNQTVQADANGNFTINMAQRALPIPGTRYEVTLTANQGNQTAESRLVLFQRQG